MASRHTSHSHCDRAPARSKHTQCTHKLQVHGHPHQQKFRLHPMRQPCILMQATSNLHPEHPEHPNTKYPTRLHPVLGHHLPQLPPHPERFNNTTPYPDSTPPDLLLNLSSGTASVSSYYQPSWIVQKGLISANTIWLLWALSEKATVLFILTLR